MRRGLAVLSVVVAVVGFGHRTDAALVVVKNAEQVDPNVYDGDIVTPNLLTDGQGSYAGGTFTGTLSGGSFDAVRDGVVSTTSMANALYINNNYPARLDFQFNLDPATGGCAQGYDITRILTIAAWRNTVDYAGQHCSIFIKPVGGSFVGLTSAVNDPASGNWGYACATETVYTDSSGTIATGIEAVRFIYNAPFDSSNALMLQEISIVGSPVPEPVCLGLVACAAMLLGGRHRLA